MMEWKTGKYGNKFLVDTDKLEKSNDDKEKNKYPLILKYKSKNVDEVSYAIKKQKKRPIEVEEGFSNKEEDIKALKWLSKTFGGRVVGNKENGTEKNADFTFRGGKLELKTFNNPNIGTIDKKVQKAIKQIDKNPYGIMLDITKTHQPLDVIKKAVEKRIDISNKPYNIKVIYKDGNKYFVKEYRKK